MEAFDLKYMKRIKWTLHTVGAWPHHVFDGSKSTKIALIRRYGYTTVLLTMCFIGLLPQYLYVVENKETLGFIDLGQTIFTMLMGLVYIQRNTLPLQLRYRSVIEDFALNFHLVHHRNKSEISAKIYKRVNMICEIATLIIHVAIFVTIFTYNGVPFATNWKAGMFQPGASDNGTFLHSINYVLPMDHNNGVGYIVTALYNFFMSYNLAVLMCGHDLFICVLVFHIWGHLSICEYNMNYFPRPRVDVDGGTVPLKYSTEENKEVAGRLKDIIVHFKMIKQFVGNTSDAYSVLLCFYYAFHMVIDCVLLLECSTLDSDALTRYGFMTVVVVQQMVQLSVVFELIATKGDSLVDAVYNMPWECMDNRNRKTVLIFMPIAQQSLALKACGMVPVGVQTMLAVLKASFSYFMMLRAFATQ